MGFDVDAYYPDDGSAVSSAAKIKAAFVDAERWLKDNAGGCDGFISLGSLDCGQSIGFLEKALGLRFDPAKGGIRSPDEVLQMSAAADWADPAAVPEEELWAYWSARKFLEVCVAHGLGIWTS